jgi:ATP-binding cassette subfamily C (CFTR/MRP) protein 1
VIFPQFYPLHPANQPLHTGATSCIVQLAILCVLGKYLAAIIPVLAAALFLVQRYYLRTSRQVRLIDIEAKAPVYKHFVETARGVSTIRAYRWGPTFHEKSGEILDEAQRPFYMLFCIQQWLALVLDLIVGALAVVLVALATSVSGSLSAGALGVALVLILEFNGTLAQSIQSWTKLETSIGAVARIQQFVQQTPLEPAGVAVASPDWPSRGAIRIQNAVARYT